MVIKQLLSWNQTSCKYILHQNCKIKRCQTVSAKHHWQIKIRFPKTHSKPKHSKVVVTNIMKRGVELCALTANVWLAINFCSYHTWQISPPINQEGEHPALLSKISQQVNLPIQNLNFLADFKKAMYNTSFGLTPQWLGNCAGKYIRGRVLPGTPPLSSIQMLH